MYNNVKHLPSEKNMVFMASRALKNKFKTMSIANAAKWIDKTVIMTSQEGRVIINEVLNKNKRKHG